MTSLLATWLLGCGTPEPPPATEKPVPAARQVVPAPTITWSLPTRNATTPVPVAKGHPALGQDLARIRKPLQAIVERHGPDPKSPWAVAHAMLALGPEVPLNGVDKPAIDYLAERYGQRKKVGDTLLWTFPPSEGPHLVDVHTDLLLKAFTEGGLTPDRPVTVQNRSTTLGDLYRYSLRRAWVDGARTGFREKTFNDAPWALQALTAWAPTDLTYTAVGNRDMTLQKLTHALREIIARETAPMKAARDAGRTMQKDTRQGFFRYTCGGQHALQGLTYAVARGFGDDVDRAETCDQLDLLQWRIDVELSAVDQFLADAPPQLQILLFVQRLKFLGHTLETVHKAAAMEVCELSDTQRAADRRVAKELIRTVDALSTLEAFDDLDAIRRDPAYDRMRRGGGQQVALDLIGDSAHAIRGIDMATGKGSIRY